MDSNYGDETERGEASMIDQVIPVYNGAELLRTREQELLELAKKNSDLRIYIVDDGSEDEFAVASKMLVSHSRISVIYLSENKGRAVARNSGASAGEELTPVLSKDRAFTAKAIT
jgi:glycosyltransferase involved in cell wall biosynthesis